MFIKNFISVLIASIIISSSLVHPVRADGDPLKIKFVRVALEGADENRAFCVAQEIGVAPPGASEAKSGWACVRKDSPEINLNAALATLMLARGYEGVCTLRYNGYDGDGQNRFAWIQFFHC